MRRGTGALLAVVACAVGVVVGLLAGHEFTSEWFEAVGVWVGALGTVGAIVWAVRSFQIEQGLRATASQRAEREAQRQIAYDASLVVFRARLGALRGSNLGGPKTVLNVSAEISNNSDHAAIDVRLEFPSLPIKPPPRQTLQPHTAEKVSLQVGEWTLTEGDAQDRARVEDGGELRFTMHGRRWLRLGNGKLLSMDESSDLRARSVPDRVLEINSQEHLPGKRR